MPKQTLLDMTQRILSSMTADEVNSYDDNEESEAVAFIIRDTYLDLINNIDVPEHRKLVTLTAHADVTTPTHMTIPDGVRRIEELKYNVVASGDTARDYQDMVWIEPGEFLRRTLMRDSDDTDVDIVSINGGEVLIRSDQAPTYFSSFDDNVLVFDAYDSSVDSTLQSSKFIVWAIEEPTFTMSDAFVPDLDSNLFPLLLNEVKSIAHVEMNQQSNPKAEQMARRQRGCWMNDRHNVDSANHVYKGPNYGRRTSKRA